MKILFATDGTEYSEGAARFLSNLDLSSKDEIIIFHVINFVLLLNTIELYSDTIMEIKQEVAPKIIDSATDILRSSNAILSTAIAEGEADESIIKASTDIEADLIVMGARGIKGIKSILLGSTARSVAFNSSTPVLIVKNAQWEITDKLKILFATDGSDHSEAAGKFLTFFPFHRDSEITILNVILSAIHDIPERFFIEIDDRIKEDVAKARKSEFEQSEKIIDSYKEYLSEKYNNVHGLTKVGDPSTEILTETEILKTDVIVLGSRGLKGIKEFIGSVSRNILRHSDCSILIVKTG